MAPSASVSPPIQRITVPSFEERWEPRWHLVYMVRVELPGHGWVVQRRYSDFEKLHARLTPPAPPAPLPPKQMAQRSWRMIVQLGGLLSASEAQAQADAELAEERRVELEHYLRAILASPEPYWRESEAWATFLEIPKTLPAAQTKHSAAQMGTPVRTLRPWRDTASPAAAESDTTRQLDDYSLLQHQTNTLMSAQDAQAEQLARVLHKQRVLGVSIYDELQQQHELLGALDSDVQRTRARIDAADAQLHHLQR